MEKIVDEERYFKVVENDEPLSDLMLTMKVPPPFLQWLKKKEYNDKFNIFLAKLSNLSINIPLLEVIQEIPGYAKLMNQLMSKKCLVYGETIEITHGCSAIMASTVTKNKEDPEAFTIPCTIGTHKFEKTLCDLGGNINIMPYTIYWRLGLDTPTPITMRLLMADRYIKRPIGVFFYVLVKVNRFIILADFIMIDCEIDQEISIILGRPFLTTGRAIIDMELGEIKFWVQDDEVSF
ncbi:uncharacterized protein LOC107849135 [Capsicum annuum]|uniref:uncharacterized protein LOC107849135 n=1 Tax=Capsicum annuum TaxID=4072 RepID=UPI001FB12D77|nr:uncharacterized protein LOC107849135 [Capsicum annuum]